MKREDIKQGRIYAAKRPKCNVMGEFNDRQVLYLSGDVVQYDSPTVRNGRRYPTMKLDKFAEWAGEDVTDRVPKGEWRTA